MNISDELADISTLLEIAHRRLDALGQLRRVDAEPEPIREDALANLAEARILVCNLRELDRYKGGLLR